MSDEIELVSDGDGLAVIGDDAAVERFLSSAGVPSRDLGLGSRLGDAARTGSSLAQSASEATAQSGRWVKLTKESAEALELGTAMTGSTGGVVRAIVTEKGKAAKILEIVKPGTAGALASPAMLAGAAGVMAQLAMQQQMDEISDYLAVIDAKVDDILRAQKDAALAEMIGVGLTVDEAMTIRERVGRVSSTTWSKVQGSSQTIAAAQAYALRQLDGIAAKLERTSGVGDLADTARAAEGSVEEWLAVLARCFQLQDALAVLELDHVAGSSVDDLEQHRFALREARRRRQELISTSAGRLLERMDAAAGVANSKVLLHPLDAAKVVRSGNHVAADISAFTTGLGIDSDRQDVAARSWATAVADVRDGAVHSASSGVAAVGRAGGEAIKGGRRIGSDVAEGAQRVSGEALDGARRVAGDVAGSVGRRLPWRRRSGDDAEG